MDVQVFLNLLREFISTLNVAGRSKTDTDMIFTRFNETELGKK
mgnify:CR=1 FL=1